MKLTICGSSQFYEDWINISNELSERGIACVIPNPVTSEEKFQNDHGRQKMLSMKPEWTKRHFERIENSDGILVVNNKKNGIGGYIGSNTLIEIGVAFYLGKKIFFMYPIGEDHPHYEELFGMVDVILNGNLDMIR